MTATLSSTDFAAISPLLIILGGALAVLLMESFASRFSKKYAFFVTLATLSCALVASAYSPASENPLLTPWLRFDQLTHLFTTTFLIIGLCSAFFAHAFFKIETEVTTGEYFFLLLSAIFGLILIGQSADFLILFLGLETLSISLYVLCGYIKKWKLSHEAALKYFVMGALAAGFLLYGIALIYGALGTTSFSSLSTLYPAMPPEKEILFYSGLAFITVGLAFKAALAPFHFWAPDVYCGSTTPATAFMAVGTKGGAFAALVLIFLIALPQTHSWQIGMAWLAYPTLILANFLALRQINFRRFFAYSGISHAGFMLIPLVAGTADALPSLFYYFAIYGLATFGCFSVLACLDQGSEGALMRHTQGLFYRAPWLAGLFSLSLLTLAGIPPTAGFFSKFFVFKTGFEGGYIALVVVGLLTAIIAAYYYLRIIGNLFASQVDESKIYHSWPATVVGTLAVIGIIILSFYPGSLMNFLITFQAH